jgi:ADP-ribosylation factor-like protein 8
LKIVTKQRIPIAIVGLGNAGKSALSFRMQTGKFKPTNPTAGMDVEFVNIEGNLLQLLDLGGQKHFRDIFWQNYVRMSQGIIFVVDSNDVVNLDDVSKWLWKCLNWNINAPILILSNKIDLDDHIELEKLISILKLDQISVQNINRSFRIFEVSVKSNINVKESLKWFSTKVSQEIHRRKTNLLGIYVYLPTGIPIVSHLFIDNKRSELDIDIIPGIINAIDTFTSGVMGANSGLRSIKTEEYVIIKVKRNKILCTLITDESSDVSATRMAAESILDYIENNFDEKISKFAKDGKIRFPRDFILNYIKENLSDSVVIENLRQV